MFYKDCYYPIKPNRLCFCYIQNKAKAKEDFLERQSNEATKFFHPLSPSNSSCLSTAQTQLCIEKGEALQFAILKKINKTGKRSNPCTAPF